MNNILKVGIFASMFAVMACSVEQEQTEVVADDTVATDIVDGVIWESIDLDSDDTPNETNETTDDVNASDETADVDSIVNQ
jgi:hypothetical protein